jgi:hypothetical protein
MSKCEQREDETGCYILPVSIDRDDADERIARIDALLEELRLNSSDLAQINLTSTALQCIVDARDVAFARAVRKRDAGGRTTRVSLWSRRKR